eukprot:g3369.t1
MASFDMDNPKDREVRVTLLMDRLKHSSSVDRVDIVEELRNISKTCRSELGKLSLPALVEAVCHERNQDVVMGVLEVLMSLVKVDSDSTFEKDALINTEFLLQDKKTLSKLLELMGEEEVWIRLNAIELLNILATNRPELLGNVILSVDAGFMKLVDVLEDRTEAIRNQLLLLLIRLTADNEQLQNFCAFNEVFDRLYQIMLEEGLGIGGEKVSPSANNEVANSVDNLIIADCLRIICNCLRKNQVTRKMFMMSKCVAGLLHLLEGNPPLPKPRKQHGIASGGSVESYKTKSGNDKKTASALFANSDSKTVLSDGSAVSAPTTNRANVAFDDFSTLEETGKETSSAVELLLELLDCLLGDVPQVRQGSVLKSTDAKTLEVEERARQQVCGFQEQLCSIGYLSHLCRLAFGHWVASKGESLQSLRMSAIKAVGLLTARNPKSLRELDAITVVMRLGSAAKPASSCLMHLCLREADDNIRLVAMDAFVNGINGCPEAAIAFIAQTMTPSPEMLDDTSKNHFDPPAGRLLIDALLTSTDRAIMQAGLTGVSTNYTKSFQKLSPDAPSGSSSSSSSNKGTLVLWAHWRCSRVVEIILRGGLTCQELAMRIPAGEKFLLERILRQVSQAVRVKGASPVLSVSLLRFLCVWLARCPRAVTEVLSSPANLYLFDLAAGRTLNDSTFNVGETEEQIMKTDQNISRIACLLVGSCFLTVSEGEKATSKSTKKGTGMKKDQVGSKEILTLISQRIGLERFQSSIDEIGISAEFRSAVRLNPLSVGTSLKERRMIGDPPFFDRSFVEFYREIVPSIKKVIYSVYMGTENLSESMPNDVEDLQMMVVQLKQLVRMQADQLNDGQTDKKEKENDSKRIEILQLECKELKEKFEECEKEKNEFSKENENLEQDILALSSAFNEMESECANLRSLAGNEEKGNVTVSKLSQKNLDVMKASLERKIENQQIKLEEMSKKNEEWKEKFHIAEEKVRKREEEILTLKNKLSLLNREKEKMEENIKRAKKEADERNNSGNNSENDDASIALLNMKKQYNEAMREWGADKDRYAALQAEQRDLLLLLANQEIEKDAISQKLKFLGGDQELHLAVAASKNALEEVASMDKERIDPKLASFADTVSNVESKISKRGEHQTAASLVH